MNPLREKALEKMLVEMKKQHSEEEDAIHNWLCDQMDDKLFKGILKEGRTIKGSMHHCMSEASKQRSGNVAMVLPEKVFNWVFQYFTDDTIPENQNNIQKIASMSVVDSKKPQKKIKAKVVKEPNGEQLDLLSFL